jgi:hypothetical protein
MNEHEFSFNDDAASGGEPEYEWIDEWLCEYVDGTMDPALETVFEEYVEANPDLKAHVENLRETRELLCQCSELKKASKKAQKRVCSQVECEMLRSQASLRETFSDRTTAVLGVASSIVVALVVGFFAGAVLFSPDGTTVSLTPPTIDRSEAPASVDRPAVYRTSRPLPLPSIQHAASWMSPSPSAVPASSMRSSAPSLRSTSTGSSADLVPAPASADTSRSSLPPRTLQAP